MVSGPLLAACPGRSYYPGLHACTPLSMLRSSKRVHSTGHFNYISINASLDFATEIPKRECRSWNIKIHGLVKKLNLRQAVAHFLMMRANDVKPDKVTYSIVIPCCDMVLGRQIHAETVKLGVYRDAVVGTNLIKMYGGRGDLGSAKEVFDEMPQTDLVMWNAVIGCCFECGAGDIGLGFFRELCKEENKPDQYTYSIVLTELVSSTRLLDAMLLHSMILRRGYGSDCFISSSLVDLYLKCGFLASGLTLFEETGSRDMVSWTTMIVGLFRSEYIELGISFFQGMRRDNFKPNSFTFGGMLSCCADLNASLLGKQLHGIALKIGFGGHMVVGSAIVDVYSKCGEMDNALTAFRGLPEKDIVSWNCIICGHASNGESTESLELFNEMLRAGSSTRISPNVITYVGVLSACSHGGLVKEGCGHFADMVRKHRIEPTREHYACMIDLLGRAGFLDEAENLLANLPLEPDPTIFGALLGACKEHGNLNLAKQVAQHLYLDEPFSSSNYVILANSYARISGWSEALEIRESMGARGVVKKVGYSWIEIGGCMNVFRARDDLHPLIGSIRDVLRKLYLHAVWL